MEEHPVSFENTDSVSLGPTHANVRISRRRRCGHYHAAESLGEWSATLWPLLTSGLTWRVYATRALQRGHDKWLLSSPLRSNNRLKTFQWYTSLPGITVCKLCQANGDFNVAEVSFGSCTTHLRWHLDATGKKGDLKKHKARRVARAAAVAGHRARKMREHHLLHGRRLKTFTQNMVRFTIDSNSLDNR